MSSPIHPVKFFSHLKWLDGKPIKVLPYREKIFADILYTFAAGHLYYTLALLLRAKKNDKSLDSILTQFYGLYAWQPVVGSLG